MKKTLLASLFFFIFITSSEANERSLQMFTSENKNCYDRRNQPSTFVVDSHVHFQPFGGEALPFETMLEYLEKEKIFFVNIYGIGQKLPDESSCTYYGECL